MNASRFTLIVRSGRNEQAVYPLTKARTLIGKGSDADIPLSGWNISKQHAVLIIDHDTLFIEDLESIFGTWVNNERSMRFGPVIAETEIVIGSYRLSVEIMELASEEEFFSDVSIHAPGPVDVLDLPKPVTPAAPPPVQQPVAAAPAPVEAAPAAQPAPAAPKVNLTPPPAKPAAAAPQANTTAPAGRPSPAAVSAAQAQAVANAENAIRARNIKAPPTPEETAMFYWRALLHKALVERMEEHRIDVNRMGDSEVRSNVRALINDILSEHKDIPASMDMGELSQMVLDEAVGLGPLETLLRDPSVTEVMVNAANDIWVERRGKLELTGTSFTSDKAVLSAIERIVTPLGRRIDESSPLVDARLKDGSRVNAIIPPLALRGPCITIRKFSKARIEPEHLIGFGSISSPMIDLLNNAVLYRRNIIVSGGTGTGKTTFLNMISRYIPDDERIVTIEDAAELTLSQPNLVSLESRPMNAEGKGMVTIRDLVRNSLRMRPDRIVVGECRGAEALDMLQAMNTGHDGSLTTLHANTPRDALGRLEILVAMAGMNLPTAAMRAQIASAVHILVQLTRFSCGARKVTCISEITGMEGDMLQMQDLFVFRKTGLSATGKTEGTFDATGNVPDFYGPLIETGVDVDLSVFEAVERE